MCRDGDGLRVGCQALLDESFEEMTQLIETASVLGVNNTEIEAIRRGRRKGPYFKKGLLYLQFYLSLFEMLCPLLICRDGFPRVSC